MIYHSHQSSMIWRVADRKSAQMRSSSTWCSLLPSQINSIHSGRTTLVNSPLPRGRWMVRPKITGRQKDSSPRRKYDRQRPSWVFVHAGVNQRPRAWSLCTERRLAPTTQKCWLRQLRWSPTARDCRPSSAVHQCSSHADIDGMLDVLRCARHATELCAAVRHIVQRTSYRLWSWQQERRIGKVFVENVTASVCSFCVLSISCYSTLILHHKWWF